MLSASQNKAALHSVMKADLVRAERRTRKARGGGGRRENENLDRKRNGSTAEGVKYVYIKLKGREMQQKQSVILKKAGRGLGWLGEEKSGPALSG